MNEALLRAIPLFEALNSEELGALAQYLHEEHCPEHSAIFWMNEQSHNLYIVASGEVQISYPDEEGREVALTRLGPGAFFGELSLIDGGPHSANARTVAASTLLRLDRDSFYLFLQRHPGVALTLLKVLSLRLRRSTVQQRALSNPNDQIRARRSRFQRSVDALASVFTSSLFLVLYVLFVACWIIGHSIRWRQLHGAPISYLDEPPTFFFLGFIVSLFSSLLTVFILNSQRRQAEGDRIRADIEYQVNLKAQAELVKLQNKMDELLERLDGGHNGPKEG